MVQRLFLDGIDAEPARPAVGRQYHGTLVVLADETESALSLLEPAGARTEIALYMRVVDPVPVFRFMIGFRDLGCVHGKSRWLLFTKKMNRNWRDINNRALTGCNFSTLIQTWIK
jgi:hypothetical protein